MATDLRNKLIAIIEPELATIGYELVELVYKPRGSTALLRVYIDAEAGVGLEDCAKASRRISSVLDVEDPVPGAYELEVSSPGFDRPLRTLEHFQRYVGSQVKVETLRPLDGRRRFKGPLLAANAEQLRMEVDGTEREIPFPLVERASLVPEA